VELISESISLSRLTELSEQMFGGLVKAVVDVRLGLMVVGGELHSDEEVLLIGQGSAQADGQTRRTTTSPNVAVAPWAVRITSCVRTVLMAARKW
jgi:hypothetical protein